MSYVQLLFPDFSLILCGFLLCRFTPLNRTVWAPVAQLVYYVFFPVLLLYSIFRTPLDLHAASRLLGRVRRWRRSASRWPMPCPSYG